MTVSELQAELANLPAEAQDLHVFRYSDEWEVEGVEIALADDGLQTRIVRLT